MEETRALEVRNLKEMSRLLKALGDPTRLRLIELLARQKPGRALCVTALGRRLGVSQPAVSQHLRVLRKLSLVQGQRRGTRVHYFIDEEALAEYREKLDAILGQYEG